MFDKSIIGVVLCINIHSKCCAGYDVHRIRTTISRIKSKNKKYHIVGTVLKSIKKIVGRRTIDTPKISIYVCSVSWLGAGISVKHGEVKLFISAKTWLLCEMTQQRQ
jgi:hypothetical protein